MDVLHLYPKKDSMIQQHVGMLQAERMGYDTDHQPAIVHVHGCWDLGIIRQAERYRKQGARLVFSPHDQLEPWIMAERRLPEKLPRYYWQKRLAEHAYVVIAHGKMEADSLAKLGWNPRVEIVRNAVVTNSVTPDGMRRQTESIYSKVMDSNTLQLMSEQSRLLLTLALKAGITGDGRWVQIAPPVISETDWRRLIIYAEQENVRAAMDHGLRLLNLSQPYIDTRDIHSYLPTNYQQPRVKSAGFIEIMNETRRAPLSLRHLLEMDRALRNPELEEDKLVEAVEELGQTKYFRRLLQLLSEQTGLDEGFMPLQPLNDRKTNKIRNLLANHLRI